MGVLLGLPWVDPWVDPWVGHLELSLVELLEVLGLDPNLSVALLGIHWALPLKVAAPWVLASFHLELPWVGLPRVDPWVDPWVRTKLVFEVQRLHLEVHG